MVYSFHHDNCLGDTFLWTYIIDKAFHTFMYLLYQKEKQLIYIYNYMKLIKKFFYSLPSEMYRQIKNSILICSNCKKKKWPSDQISLKNKDIHSLQLDHWSTGPYLVKICMGQWNFPVVWKTKYYWVDCHVLWIVYILNFGAFYRFHYGMDSSSLWGL